MKKAILISLVPVLVIVAMLASCAALANPSPSARQWGEMSYLLQKTFLKVDAATATVRVDEATAARLEEIGGDRDKLDKALDREMAEAVFESLEEAEIELRFHVSFGKDRFMKSSRQSLEKARKAGYIDKATEQRMLEEMPERFAWMDEDGISKGDVMRHILEGDRVRTQFITADGEMKVDRTREGPARRATLLASFFGEKSDFRKGLFESFFEDEG